MTHCVNEFGLICRCVPDRHLEYRVSIVPGAADDPLRLERLPGGVPARLSQTECFLGGNAVRAYFAQWRQPLLCQHRASSQASPTRTIWHWPPRPWSRRGVNQANATARAALAGRRGQASSDLADAVNISTVHSATAAQDACFQPCSDYLPAPVIKGQPVQSLPIAPLYPADDAVRLNDPLGVQLQLAARCIGLGQLARAAAAGTPLTLDGDAYVPPQDAVSWRNIFDAQASILGGADPTQVACISRCITWLVIQEVVSDHDLPPTPLPPASSRGGISRGPQIAPPTKNPEHGGWCHHADRRCQQRCCRLPGTRRRRPAVVPINSVRPFAGYGVQIMGRAQFINVRRAVSAIERRCKAALDTGRTRPSCGRSSPKRARRADADVRSGGYAASRPRFYIRCGPP